MPSRSSGVNAPVTQPVRRRRAPQEAEAEIAEAARALLTERPVHEVTVRAIMERTTLSRKSFYVYFPDRYALLTRLLRPLQEQRDAILAPLYQADEPLLAAGSSALLGMAGFYAEHGRLLRALAHASEQDGHTRRAWQGFLEPIIRGHLRLVEAEVAAGRITGIDPEPTTRALIAMNLQYFFDELVDRPDADLEAVSNTLTRIWARTLYGLPTP